MKTEIFNLLPLTEEYFDLTKDATPILLVKFETARCGACKMLQPILIQLARAYSGKVTFATIDVESNPSLMASYKITSLPTLVLFKDGQLQNRYIGVVAKKVIANDIERMLQDPSSVSAA
jgi:thioredoxin 1